MQIEQGHALCRQVYDIYHKAVEEKELLHKELSYEEFIRKFFSPEPEIRKIVVANEGGFAAGCVEGSGGKLFITLVGVEEGQRRKGFGRAILSELEELLKEEHRDVNAGSPTEISFFNPQIFTWEVPGRAGVTHPNAPGVDTASGAYLFLKNCGYRDFACQNSYYLPLTAYEYPSDMEKKKAALAEKGFTFVAYDREKHGGMEEMIKGLGNPMWERDILKEPAGKEGGRPILIPVYNGRVCGFTGPLDVEESGRGFFAGIAIDAAYRGNGMAKVLFCELCAGLKNLGAEYMTLFTGENNPARNIYEAAGFSIVRSWVDMRKEKEYGG